MTELNAHTRRLLEQYHFDEAAFRQRQKLLREHGYSPSLAELSGRVDRVEPLPEEELSPLPARGTAARDALRRRGEDALRRGEVAVLLLNGGMATRFGGVAKGAALALGRRSFLGLRIGQVRQVAQALGARVPVVLMDSFATHDATVRHLEAEGRFGLAAEDLHYALQCISMRLTPEGEIFRGADGEPSLYATGHGDLPAALELSGVAAPLRAAGVRTLFVSNVDNLGAELDPAVIGAHLGDGAAQPAPQSPSPAMTAELVERGPGDVGGAPAHIDGRAQLVEGFRLPPGFDVSRLIGFNTNSFYFEWAALDPSLGLGFYPVAKQVEGRKAIQFERILGEVSGRVGCRFLVVGRDRFLPVKTVEDLASLRSELEKRYG